MRVFGPDGQQLGIMETSEALSIAGDLGLDLFEVSADADPPVARILDYGKLRYEDSIREKRARKHQQHVVVKEVKLRPRIEAHDLAIKAAQARKFLERGFRVKVTVTFRGREQSHPELGVKALTQFQQTVGDVGVAERIPELEDRRIAVLLVPRQGQRGTNS